jgi:hypothetical protein
MTSWLEQVKVDLAPFADTSADGPRIRWTVTPKGEAKAEWTAQGRDMSATFTESPTGLPTVKFGRRKLSYLAFLADANVGGLHRLAERVADYHKAFRYVETLATFTGADDETKPANAEPAVELLLREIDSLDSDFTNVLFLTGEAGSGKTCSLRHLTIDRAQQYLSGEASSLFIYVNAQGRALATFDQALSVELDDLRSQLTYDMIAPLVRNGLLIPIVDGFDELLGASYDDSFSSLSRFLGTLQGRGRLIACARSTYYEQEFLNRMTKESRPDLSWQVRRVQMLDWDSSLRRKLADIEAAARGRADDAELIARQVERAFESDELHSIAGKPFFVAKVIQLFLEGGKLNSAQSIFEALVDAYVEREVSEKLLDNNQRPLLSAPELRRILIELSSEMWLIETRQLQPDMVRDIVALVLGDAKRKGQVQDYLHMRGPMLGFLTSSLGGKRVEFEHELMFAYFLAHVFVQSLKTGAQLPWLLARGVLPPRVSDVAAQYIADDQRARTAETLCEAAKSLETREDQGRANAGAFVMALASREKAVFKWRLHDIIIGGGTAWEATFTESHFERLSFYRSDLSHIRLSKCVASEVTLIDVLVTPGTTLLDVEGLDPTRDVFGLRSTTAGELFVPSDILSALENCGLHTALTPPPDNIAPALMDFMQRLARAFARTNLVWPDDPDKRWSRFPAWETVRPLLVENGLLIEERRENKGSHRTALRARFESSLLMRGAAPGAAVPPEVQAFWQALRSASGSV